MANDEETKPEKSEKPTLVERLGFAAVMGTTLFVAFILWVNVNVALEPRYDEIRQMHRWRWSRVISRWTSRPRTVRRSDQWSMRP